MRIGFQLVLQIPQTPLHRRKIDMTHTHITCTAGHCGARSCPNGSPLLRCSRCRSIFYCSPTCAKSYWPFHKSSCKKNEFADQVEGADPKFASWLREHGRQAQLKDDEIERIEAAAVSNSGTGPRSRHEAQETMYGRLVPSPQAPSYTESDLARMKDRERAEQLQRQARGYLCASAASSSLGSGWGDVDVPPKLGCEFSLPPPDTATGESASSKKGGSGGTEVKWRQSLTHVEVFIKLDTPVGRTGSGKLDVQFTPTSLLVSRGGTLLLGGTLCKPVLPFECRWAAEGHLLEISMMKKSRRGYYAPGESNADTYWPWLLELEPSTPTPALPAPSSDESAAPPSGTPVGDLKALSLADTDTRFVVGRLNVKFPPTEYYLLEEREPVV